MEKLTKKEIKALKNQINENLHYNLLRESMEIISNEDRYIILNLLNEKPHLLSQIEKELNKNQPSIAHHLRILEKYNLIKSSKKGKFNEYSINRIKFSEILNAWNHWFQII